MTAMDIINAAIAKLAEDADSWTGSSNPFHQHAWNCQVNLVIHMVSVVNDGWGERTCSEYVIERLDDIRCAAV